MVVQSSGCWWLLSEWRVVDGSGYKWLSMGVDVSGC